MIGLQRLEFEETDRALVRRFARDQDGEAFSILVGRYADPVYTTCRRILRDEALAADATQETFFQLVKHADRITGSLAGWLHRVATCRALDMIRQNASRRRREQAYALDGVQEPSSWAEVEPAVDEVLEQLPDELREILLLHFLQGRTTIQIAAAKGVSQPTISRRLNEALELLRQELRAQGIQAGLVPLQTVLLHSNHAAPEALRLGLGKIALAKAAGVSASSVPLAGAVAKAGLAATAAILVVGLWVGRREVQPLPLAVGQTTTAQPQPPPSTAAPAESGTRPSEPGPNVAGSPADAIGLPPPPAAPTLRPASGPSATPTVSSAPDPTPEVAIDPQNAPPPPVAAGSPPGFRRLPLGRAVAWRSSAPRTIVVVQDSSNVLARPGGGTMTIPSGIYQAPSLVVNAPPPTSVGLSSRSRVIRSSSAPSPVVRRPVREPPKGDPAWDRPPPNQ